MLEPKPVKHENDGTRGEIKLRDGSGQRGIYILWNQKTLSSEERKNAIGVNP